MLLCTCVCVCLTFVSFFVFCVILQSPVKKTVTNWLVEDRVRQDDSYIELLCSIHTQIQSRMAY